MEEAVHLLRGAPSGTLFIYYAGSAPFILGLLFFWAHTTWFTPATTTVAGTALLLAAAFAVMKAAHAEFCARLLCQRLATSPLSWSWSRGAGLLGTQLRLQAWGLFVLPAALVAVVPFGWTYAYFQNVSVLADAPDAGSQARAQAALWPGQNHLGLLILFLLGLCAWANLAAACWLLPWLADRLLGIENLFGLSGGWFFNSTFLASVTMLTWLMVDPLVKTFYVLRVFHGRSRRTGEDVRLELRAARPPGRALRGLVAVLALAVLGLAGSRTLRAEEAAAPARPITAVALDQAIDRTLADADFQWRLRPVPQTDDHAKDGVFRRFLRNCAETLVAMLRAIGRWIGSVIDWMANLFPSGRNRAGKSSGGAGHAVLTLVLMIAIGLAVLLIGWIVVLVWRRASPGKTITVAAQPVAPATPDLQDESTQAAQLPADGWLALAREKMALGEWRLALRALHLATLARLAVAGLVSLAKYKTNLDYEREVQRRALGLPDVAMRFGARRREFEAAWYGRAQMGENEVRHWLAELERSPSP